jgi:hypothetical protein
MNVMREKNEFAKDFHEAAEMRLDSLTLIEVGEEGAEQPTFPKSATTF